MAKEDIKYTINGKEMLFQDITLDDIVEYCKANNQTEWLKALAAQTTEYKIYPKKRVPQLDENGNPILTKKGTPKMVSVADYDKEPKVEVKPISFIEIKTAFAEKFLEKKAKPKKPNMYDKIKAL